MNSNILQRYRATEHRSVSLLHETQRALDDILSTPLQAPGSLDAAHNEVFHAAYTVDLNTDDGVLQSGAGDIIRIYTPRAQVRFIDTIKSEAVEALVREWYAALRTSAVQGTRTTFDTLLSADQRLGALYENSMSAVRQYVRSCTHTLVLALHALESRRKEAARLRAERTNAAAVATVATSVLAPAERAPAEVLAPYTSRTVAPPTNLPLAQTHLDIVTRESDAKKSVEPAVTPLDAPPEPDCAIERRLYFTIAAYAFKRVYVTLRYGHVDSQYNSCYNSNR